MGLAENLNIGLPSWYVVEDVLARMSHGAVVKARDSRIANPDESAVAIKCIPREYVALKPKYIEREILHHRQLWHRHIVMFRELLLTGTHLCIVLDYIGGGTLHKLVSDKRCLDEEISRWYFQQLILAIDYCHQLGVMNRDIKLEHLIVGEGHEDHPLIYICDFGLSKHISNSETKTLLGSRHYIAPEVIYQGAKGQRYDGKKADIYSCGVCLVVMLFGYFPQVLASGQPVMGGASDETDLHGARDRVNTLPSPPDNAFQVAIPNERNIEAGRSAEPISSACISFLMGLLEPCPEKRLTMEQIWSHPWFRTKLPQGARRYNQELVAAQGKKHGSNGRLQSYEDLRKMVELAMRP